MFFWAYGSSWAHGLMGSLVHDKGSWIHGSWVYRLMGSWFPVEQKTFQSGVMAQEQQQKNDDEPTMKITMILDSGRDFLCGHGEAAMVCSHDTRYCTTSVWSGPGHNKK